MTSKEGNNTGSVSFMTMTKALRNELMTHRRGELFNESIYFFAVHCFRILLAKRIYFVKLSLVFLLFSLLQHAASEEISFLDFVNQIRYPLVFDHETCSIDVDLRAFNKGDSFTVTNGELFFEHTFIGIDEENNTANWKITSHTNENNALKVISVNEESSRFLLKPLIRSINPSNDKFSLQEYQINNAQISTFVVERRIRPGVTRLERISPIIPIMVETTAKVHSNKVSVWLTAFNINNNN